jgi:hypothetical protein
VNIFLRWQVRKRRLRTKPLGRQDENIMKKPVRFHRLFYFTLAQLFFLKFIFRYHLLFFVAFGYTVSYGQQFEMAGVVLDAETYRPLPFATVWIEKTSKGTITNNEGKFYLQLDDVANTTIAISYVGYTTGKVKLSENRSTIKILLKPETKTLKELIVVPRETLIDFVQDAFARIEINYSQNPYLVDGFYRENLKDLISDKYYYFGEAQLRLYSNGYHKNTGYGSVKILQSRINRLTDSTEHTMYYAGPFTGNRGDKVKMRAEYLKGDDKLYSYELKGIEKLDGNEIWIIDFKHTSKPIQGSLFIEKTSKAYVRIDRTDSVESWERGGKRVAGESVVLYKKIDDKWYLQFVQTRSKRYRSRTKMLEIVSTDFSVNRIQKDSVKNIPLNEQLGFGQIFSITENNFDNDFWNGQTTTLPDSSLVHQVKMYSQVLKDSSKMITPGTATVKKKRSPYKILAKFEGQLGVQLLPYEFKNNPISLQYPTQNSTLNLNSIAYPLVPVVFVSGYSFNINRRWQIFYQSGSSLVKNFYFNKFSIGFRYSMQLPARGKPVLLRPAIGFTNVKFGRAFESIVNGAEVDFDGKKYEEDKMRFYVGEKVKILQFDFTLQKHINGLRWIYVRPGYQLDLNHDQTLWLRRRGIFKNIKDVPLRETPAIVTGKTSQFKNLYLEAGIRIQF